jgi:hypothetical protein
MNTVATFVCECPKCGQERPQTGYVPEELALLLTSGADIEAYCAGCDSYWSLSTEERVDLTRALARRK